MDTRWLGGILGGAVSAIAALYELLSHGVNVVVSILGASVLTVVVTAGTPFLAQALEERRARRAAHLQYIVREAVTPALGALGNQGLGTIKTAADFTGRFTSIFGVPNDYTPAATINENQAWRWLLEHEPSISTALSAYRSACSDTYRTYRESAARLGEEATRATGLRPVTLGIDSLARGTIYADVVASLLLSLWAHDELRHQHRLDEQLRVSRPDNDQVIVQWRQFEIASIPALTPDFQKTIEGLYWNPIVKSSVEQLALKVESMNDTQQRLVEALQVVESEGGPRGHCSRCPRAL